MLRVSMSSAEDVGLDHLASGTPFLTVRLMGAENLELLNSRKELHHLGGRLPMLDVSELQNL